MNENDLVENMPTLLAVSHTRIPHPQEAEDVCSDIYLRTIRTLRAGFKARTAAPNTIMYVIAQRAAHEALRRKYAVSGQARTLENADNRLPCPRPGPDRLYELKERAEILWDEIHLATVNLSPRQRQVLCLSWAGELTREEVAQVLGVSYRVIEVHRGFIKHKLRNRLKEVYQ